MSILSMISEIEESTPCFVKLNVIGHLVTSLTFIYKSQKSNLDPELKSYVENAFGLIMNICNSEAGVKAMNRFVDFLDICIHFLDRFDSVSVMVGKLAKTHIQNFKPNFFSEIFESHNRRKPCLDEWNF